MSHSVRVKILVPIFGLVGGEALLIHHIGDHRGVDAAAAGAHDEAVQRGQAHGGIHHLAVLDGGDGGAVADTSGKGLQLTGAVLWQLQYLSAGPNGKNEEYIKNSCIPEVYVSADYKVDGLIAGVGMEVLSLKPRQQTTVDDRVYKVNERVTSLSFEAYAKYMTQDWVIAGKTLLASNLTQACMLGGYAVTSVDPRTGEQEYTPYRHSMTWLNIVYGKKWKPGIFVGYLKNLGTGKTIAGPTYGVGLEVDQVFTTNLQLSYNLPHWKLGVEYSPSLAWYGDMNAENGKIENTHSVTNHRVLGVLIYMF